MGKRDTAPEATQGSPSDEILVLGFRPAGGTASSLSPYCAKVETLLRIAGLKYSASSDNLMKRSPKKKFPVLLHGSNVVTDSSFIVDYLKNTYPEQMAVFTPDDHTRQAVAHMAKRTLEEHFAWVLLYANWVRDEAWDDYSQKIFQGLPGLLWFVVPGQARKQVIRDVHGQGMGLLAYEDVLKRGKQDLAALSQVLGTNDYLTGDTPTEADCTLFGFVDCALQVTAPGSAIRTVLEDFPNLIAFRDRMKAKYYGPDNVSNFSA